MSPEELRDEIEAMNVDYDKLQKERDDIEDKWGKNVFRRKYDAIGRKMFKMNTQIASKLITLEKMSVGDFRPPEKANL